MCTVPLPASMTRKPVWFAARRSGLAGQEVAGRGLMTMFGAVMPFW